MVGIVNGYASRRYRGTNNVIIAHEFLHTLGATDKYSMIDGNPIAKVKLERQYSNAPCVEGKTWGYSSAEVWVDAGCRGSFRVFKAYR